ncbi:MAG TPA: ATP-dependent Clp protease adaptor ClpS [Thermoanaerobaculia bacterium]|nr:ATP-dependent Clp protease adaptor ClpS [Thermoanaerobaculia bacterium]
MPHPDWDSEGAVITESETRLQKPPLYKVLIHNDDFTTMDFVVHVLTSIFHLSETEAIHRMLEVHTQGVGLAGVYTYEVAGMKVGEVLELARANEYPLLCTMEKE